MKARTLATVAALGLAGLVGCKETSHQATSTNNSAENSPYQFSEEDTSTIVDEKTGATLKMDLSQILVSKGDMTFYTAERYDSLADVNYLNSKGEKVRITVYFYKGEASPIAIEINEDFTYLRDNTALCQNAARHYADVCSQLGCDSAINEWQNYIESWLDRREAEQLEEQNKQFPPERLD